MSIVISVSILAILAVLLLALVLTVKLSAAVIAFTVRLIRRLINRSTSRKRHEQMTYQKHNLRKSTISKDSALLGTEGEDDLYSVLSDIPGKKHVLRNLYVPKDDENTTEIDQILICRSGIYVFEYKNYHCDVYVPDDLDKRSWCRTPYGNRDYGYYFYSPFLQNEKHIETLISYLNSYTGTYGIIQKMYSYIVFGDDCNLMNASKYFNRTGIMNLRDVDAFMDAGENVETELSDESIDAIYFILFNLLDASEYVREKHIRQVSVY